MNDGSGLHKPSHLPKLMEPRCKESPLDPDRALHDLGQFVLKPREGLLLDACVGFYGKESLIAGFTP